MKDYKLMAVGQIVADCFDYAKVFNKYGIDFCCNGDVSLADACGKMGIDADCLLEELKQIKSEQSLTLDFKSWPIDLLVDYILKFHHRNIHYQDSFIYLGGLHGYNISNWLISQVGIPGVWLILLATGICFLIYMIYLMRWLNIVLFRLSIVEV